MGEGESDYKRVELVWPGKRTQVERVKLPFQVIERVNDVRRSERGQAPLLGTEMPLEWPDNWRNKLIWGDNKYVLASLVDEFAGKVDLIYIDPPFDTGSDFSYRTEVGSSEIVKEPSSIEEKAYRDTWGRGLGSYSQMMLDRLTLMKDVLSDRGSLFVHIDWRVGHHLRLLLDEVFGPGRFVQEIVWVHQIMGGSHGRRFPKAHETILWYSKSDNYLVRDDDPAVRVPFSEYIRSTMKQDADGRWFYTRRRMSRKATESERERKAGTVTYVDDPEKGTLISDVWADMPSYQPLPDELTGYPTQKPESILGRIVAAASPEGGLVADFFCGAGTTAAVAEKLSRRWIACDLGRFAIHTSRKRLLEMRARPFEVLNLGRYERRHWQVVTAGEAIAEYYRFVVELFHGEVIPGFTHLHGVKAGRLIHVGATDAPVTEAELRNAPQECKANGFTELDVLGWEWEMGLNREGGERLARECDVKLRLFNIPREVMDKRAVEAGDVHFFEVSVADLKAEVSRNEAIVELAGFLPAVDDYMRKKVGGADLKWSDWIDYWSIDFEHDGETFINQWQAYRTRKNRTLSLRSDPHQYGKPAEYSVVVKVIDIFGNDTTQQLTVEAG